MPRLPPALVSQASREHRLLPRILRECGDLSSARNELRWLQEHAAGELKLSSSSTSIRITAAALLSYANRRTRGEPLQYILGSQPFGDLDILCRKNVLIPRPETERFTSAIAALLLRLRAQEVNSHSAENSLSIADLCTGSGCISLLLHSLLNPPTIDESVGEAAHKKPLHIAGFDISPHALKLACDNLLHNVKTRALDTSASVQVSFHHLDVLATASNILSARPELAPSSPVELQFLRRQWDVIISNPPYISPSDYAPGGTTTRSVRKYEPKLALVPPPLLQNHTGSATPQPYSISADAKLAGLHAHDLEQADQFYHAILHMARLLGTKLVVMEIGDADQARRVRAIIDIIFHDEVDIVVETWRDDGEQDRYRPSRSVLPPQGDDVAAHERAVVLWRGSYAAWRLAACIEASN